MPHLGTVVFIAIDQSERHRRAEAVALLLGKVDVARQVGPVHFHAAGEEQCLPFAVEACTAFVVFGTHGVAQWLGLTPTPFLVLLASEQIHERLARDGVLIGSG